MRKYLNLTYREEYSCTIYVHVRACVCCIENTEILPKSIEMRYDRRDYIRSNLTAKETNTYGEEMEEERVD